LNGKGVNAQYATGSKSFTLTLRRIVGGVASHHFKYFLSYGAPLSPERNDATRRKPLAEEVTHIQLVTQNQFGPNAPPMTPHRRIIPADRRDDMRLRVEDYQKDGNCGATPSHTFTGVLIGAGAIALPARLRMKRETD
jgi:hypothetical protein